MEEIIKEMIEDAQKNHDYELAGYVGKLLEKFAYTCNCPSNWRDLGEELAKEYSGNDWVMENCDLYNHIDI